MSVRFGATLLQVVPYPLLRDDFAFVESIGLDNAWVIDQFGIDGVPEIPLLEAWATLGAIAADTERIRVGSMVTNVANRNPGIDASWRRPGESHIAQEPETARLRWRTD